MHVVGAESVTRIPHEVPDGGLRRGETEALPIGPAHAVDPDHLTVACGSIPFERLIIFFDRPFANSENEQCDVCRTNLGLRQMISEA